METQGKAVRSSITQMIIRELYMMGKTWHFLRYCLQTSVVLSVLSLTLHTKNKINSYFRAVIFIFYIYLLIYASCGSIMHIYPQIFISNQTRHLTFVLFIILKADSD